MNKICLLLCCLLPGLFRAGAQELKMTECAPLTQIYGEVSESDELLPMGDVGVEFGYVLYQAAITVPAGEAALELENVRDYAAVYLDGVFQGTLTDNRKTLVLKAETGQHTLQLYVENIGRITYGPEILDNSKGLFGEARLGGETIAGWTITPLEVRDTDPETLEFEALGPCNTPCFRRGQFDDPAVHDVQAGERQRAVASQVAARGVVFRAAIGRDGRLLDVSVDFSYVSHWFLQSYACFGVSAAISAAESARSNSRHE